MAAGDGDDRPITAAEMAAVTAGLDELRQAMDDLRSASSEREKREARDEIADAREDLDALAKQLGVSRERLDSSIAAAKNAERKEELRPIIAELLSEAEEARTAAANEPEPGPEPPAAEPKPSKPPAATAPPPPPGDSEPARSHWSEKPVGSLIR